MALDGTLLGDLASSLKNKISKQSEWEFSV